MASHLIPCSKCQHATHANNKTYTNCGHSFCKDCINTRAGEEDICPICPREFDEIESLSCVICQDIITGRCGWLQCGHYYCYNCIARWLKQSYSCPICKAETTEILQTAPDTKKVPCPSFEEETPPSPNFISLDRGLDPGGERMRAHFSCFCGRKWDSAYAYEGAWQKCGRCGRGASPIRVAPLAAGQCVSGPGTHRVELCGMCQEMGRDCSMGRFTEEDLNKFCQMNSSYTN